MLRSSHPSEDDQNQLKGLFTIAVLAVIGFDCKVHWLKGGFAGVDVGLVIAGFVVCSLIDQSIRTGSFRLITFYGDAFKRIAGPLVLVLSFSLVLGLLVLSPYEAYRLGQGVVAAAIGAANFLYLVRGSFFAERAITNPLLMTWAVSLLMQFVFALSLLLWFLRKARRRTVILVIAAISLISLLCSVYLEFRQHVWNFYLPVTRSWEFGAGALLALWRPKYFSVDSEARGLQEATGFCAAAILLSVFIAYRPEMRFPGFEALPPVVGTVLFLISPRSLMNRILSSRPLSALGSISYALYLWHWLFLSFAEIASTKPLHRVTIALVLLIALVLSLACFVLVEKPLFRTSAITRGRAAIYVGWMTILAAFGGVLYFSKGLPARSRVLYGIESRAKLYRHFPCISSGTYLRRNPDCTPAPAEDEPAIAVLGGGHAEAFAEGLKDYLRSNGWQLITLTRESCPPTLGVTQWSPTDSTLAGSCREFNRFALKYIKSRQDIRTVILVGRWRASYVQDSYSGDPARQSAAESLDNLRTGLENEVAALEAAGRHVIVVEDTPEFPNDPVAGVRSRYLPWRRKMNDFLHSDPPDEGDGSGIERSVAISSDENRANEQVLAIRVTHPSVVLIDPMQILCTSTRCSFADDTDLFFFDSIHLSFTGARLLLPLLPPLHSLR